MKGKMFPEHLEFIGPMLAVRLSRGL